MRIKKVSRLPAGYWKHPAHLLACGLGSGASPVAPGTAGTVLAIPLYLLMRPLDLPVYIAAVAALGLLGIWLCGVTARDFGVHDHSGIVWDEVVGYLITMTAAPPGWPWVLAGFFLFRVFDVVKPWPIRRIDEGVHGGLGIMLDDVLAGIYGLAVLQGTHWLLARTWG